MLLLQPASYLNIPTFFVSPTSPSCPNESKIQPIGINILIIDRNLKEQKSMRKQKKRKLSRDKKASEIVYIIRLTFIASNLLHHTHLLFACSYSCPLWLWSERHSFYSVDGCLSYSRLESRAPVLDALASLTLATLWSDIPNSQPANLGNQKTCSRRSR